MPLECLVVAVSKRADGRSIIGIDSNGILVRFIAPTPSGILYPQHYRIAGDAVPRPYDLIRVDAPWPDSRPSQPENRILSGSQWQLLERPASRPHISRFESMPCREEQLFGNSGRSIRAPAVPIDRSILVIEPESAAGHCVWQPDRQRYTSRLTFQFAGATYNLPLTDIHWSARLLSHPEGTYSLEQFGCRAPHGLRLVVSLTEPFHGYCYKLVTCILPCQLATLWRDAASSNLPDSEWIAPHRPVEHARAAAGGA